MGAKILDSIKKLLGIDATDLNFDDELIMHINSVFLSLNQLGVGPEETFVLTDSDVEWDSFMKSRTDIEAVKSYIYLKVRLLFDPPQNSFLVNAISEQIKEFESRLTMQVEPYALTEEAALEAAALAEDQETYF